MNRSAIVEEARRYVRRELESDRTGHDWPHIARVAALARQLAQAEGADVFVCELAALLHDLADDKIAASEEAGQRQIRGWLEEHGAPKETTAAVLAIIATMSFKGGGGAPMATLEGMVVQDADRLDALGAIGVARTFVYAGARGHKLHDPAVAPRGAMTPAEYRSGDGTAINHFHEKLLKLKDRMNTKAAQALAAERHAFLLRYLEQFAAEWAVGEAYDAPPR
ncbi:HD domain-containing protein [Paenibacillus cymbidii]|uniref:HD domain-containing protein n=1 Tax=Paenibacillus cymbidii TaxID=1639034 RepID=UPI001080C7CD|nr:HD domain-containing protein [Paenibacillus cymbidii]